MKAKLERRSYSFEVRAEKEESGDIITGRPIVYDSKTDLGFFDEIIERGALKDTDLTDVRFLVNHDISRIPLARSRRNNENSTMRLLVDDEGMSIRVKLDTENNSEARALYSAVQRGDISGMSFMFGIDKLKILPAARVREGIMMYTLNLGLVNTFIMAFLVIGFALVLFFGLKGSKKKA